MIVLYCSSLALSLSLFPSGSQVFVFPHDWSFLSTDDQRARSWFSPEIRHYLLGLGDVEKEVVVLALAHRLHHDTAAGVFTHSDLVRGLNMKCAFGSTPAVRRAQYEQRRGSVYILEELQ